jgi:hypothetical protein
MNLRDHRTAKFLPALLCVMAGWGALRAQETVPNWPPPPPAGPYALGFNPGNGSTASDEPIPGFVGPAGVGVAPYGSQNLTQYVNPDFVEWASSVVNYSPARLDQIEPYYVDPATALGPVTGNVFDVVSLGDLSATDIAEGVAPGSLTLDFDTPIADGPGPDFVVFGNAFSLRGRNTQVFSKLAYVEVSSDGVNFARFPSVDLNPKPAGSTWSYMVSNPQLIYNLFGKAENGYGVSWGVPFDLAQLRQLPLVVAGLLDLQNVRYVRLVAVVGNGEFSSDAYGDPIYDPWPTTGSPGPEVQAIGVLNTASSSNPAANFNAALAFASSTTAGGSNTLVSAMGAKANHSTSAATASTAASGYSGFGISLLNYASPAPDELSPPPPAPGALLADNADGGSTSSEAASSTPGADSASAAHASAPARPMQSAAEAELPSEVGTHQSVSSVGAPDAHEALNNFAVASAMPAGSISVGMVSPDSPSGTISGFSTGRILKLTILVLAVIGVFAWSKRMAR